MMMKVSLANETRVKYGRMCDIRKHKNMEILHD
jgi:hypothetical protein